MERSHGPAIEEAIDEMRVRSVPGAAIAFIEEGAVSAAEIGIRSAGSPEPIGARTIFEGVSLGKPVLALAVLSLAADGLISLDAPLASYMPVPEYLERVGGGAVSARMMLNHTSGIVWSDTERGALVSANEPGAEFKYSGAAYFLLQCVVEEVLGELLNDFMTRIVFEPLRLRDTSYLWEDRFETMYAQGHDGDGRPLPKAKDASPTEADAASDIHTTALDYATLFAALITPGRFSEAIREPLLTPSVEVHEAWEAGPPRDTSWSLGLGITRLPNGSDHIWHWGWRAGFRSFATIARDGSQGVVALTNGDNGLWVCKRLVGAYLDQDHPAFAWLEH